ncbi:MAG: phosphopantetheine-binding protein [Proteobacteria bacterium]|nr:phosphopantetheine-binding protein [Pseudomonadota bacterium]
MDNELMSLIKPRQEILQKLICCLIDNLNIPFQKDLIHADVPLFGAGLGLDSIDALEVVMTVENEFGVSIDESNIQSMRTLNTLADSIQVSLNEQ